VINVDILAYNRPARQAPRPTVSVFCGRVASPPHIQLNREYERRQIIDATILFGNYSSQAVRSIPIARSNQLNL
jgi:hypothetical protein